MPYLPTIPGGLKDGGVGRCGQRVRLCGFDGRTGEEFGADPGPRALMAGWLYFSEDGARDERGMTRFVPRDALDDGTTRSRRGRCDHARRVRPDRAPARPASRVSRRHLTRRSAKSMGWNPKNPRSADAVGARGGARPRYSPTFLVRLAILLNLTRKETRGDL